ncbi:MAG: hypothetical protein Q7K16_01985 [Candidatus Azambacteria bacterium]|nr:hypothetical protein [Candidatus Azambacteria bacterium]
MRNKKLLIGLGIAVLAGFFIFFAGAQLLSAYYLKQGTTEFVKGDFVKAGPFFNRSLKFNSRNSEPHFYLGKIALGKVTETPGIDLLYPNADYAGAATHFEKAIISGLERKNKNLYLITLNDAGFSYYILKQYEKSVPLFLKYIELNSVGAFTARYFVATDYFNRSNKPREALDILLPAIEPAAVNSSKINEPNLFRVHILLARLYYYFGDYANALKYTKLVTENNALSDKFLEVKIAHTLLALDYGRQKKFTLAESEIKKASVSDCFLATAYAIGENYSKAISIAEKTNQIGGAYVDSFCPRVLAISYLAKGDKINAKKYMNDYLSVTEKFTQKDIFVMRNREQFASELLKLK